MSHTVPSRPEPPADTVFYVYGVIRPRRGDPGDTWTLPCTGVCGALASVLPCGDLAAVVSVVSARDLGPQALRLHDARWVATSALAHHRVLESLLGSCTVAPFKFGAFCPDAEAVRETIARHRMELDDLLSRVDGATEWDVRLSCERSALCALRRAPEPAGLADGAAAASEGTAYFLRRRAEERDLREADACVAARAAEVRQRLAGTARASLARPVPSRRPHRDGPVTILRDAYLVVDEDRERFLNAAAAAKRECGGPGFGLDVSGPWPAYSFVGPVGPAS